jgi:hypothetical protein
MSVDQPPEFGDKLVTIYVTGGGGACNHLQHVTFEVQGGRLFIVGRIPESWGEYNWARGKTAAIAWDCVDRYILFDSIDEYHEESRKWADHKAAERTKQK